MTLTVPSMIRLLADPKHYRRLIGDSCLEEDYMSSQYKLEDSETKSKTILTNTKVVNLVDMDGKPGKEITADSMDILSLFPVRQDNPYTVVGNDCIITLFEEWCSFSCEWLSTSWCENSTKGLNRSKGPFFTVAYGFWMSNRSEPVWDSICVSDNHAIMNPEHNRVDLFATHGKPFWLDPQDELDFLVA